MVNTVISVASALGGTFTYVVLTLLSEEGAIPRLSTFGEVGGGLTVGGLLFFILRWALKRNDNLTEKIYQMNEERARVAEQHFHEIKEILKSKT